MAMTRGWASEGDGATATTEGSRERTFKEKVSGLISRRGVEDPSLNSTQMSIKPSCKDWILE